MNTLKDEIKRYLDNAIEERVFPGCAVGVIANGKTEIVTAGRYTYDDGAPRVTERSIYDCASITKSVPVSCLALRLIDAGKLDIADPLVKYVPEYCGSFRNDIRVKHLLTHTLDFDFRLSDYKNLPAENLLNEILSVNMKSKPGEKFCYTNATSILLGMVIESVCCKSLHVAAKEIVFDPLEMNDTTFFITDDVIDNVVPTEIDSWRGREIRGEVHDESAWVLRDIMTAGSAGMFSTVTDLLKFVKMLLDEGVFGKGEKFFSLDMIEAMRTNQIPHIANQFTGLGWELNQEYMGAKRSASTFGKTGFTGTAIIIDHEKKAGVVILSNCTWSSRKPTRDAINKVRQEVADTVWERAIKNS